MGIVLVLILVIALGTMAAGVASLRHDTAPPAWLLAAAIALAALAGIYCAIGR